MTLDEGHYYIYFCHVTHGKVSLWLWKSLENSEFFLLLCGHPGIQALLVRRFFCLSSDDLMDDLTFQYTWTVDVILRLYMLWKIDDFLLINYL